MLGPNISLKIYNSISSQVTTGDIVTFDARSCSQCTTTQSVNWPDFRMF